MKGVQYLVDSSGNPTSVVLDLDVWGDLWEDFYDVLLAECSKTGITHAWEDVKAELKAMSEREAELHAELQGTD